MKLNTLPVLSLLIPLVGLPFTYSPAVQADQVHVGGIYSTDQLRGARLGYRTDTLDIDWFDWAGEPTVALETAVNHWQDSNNTSDNITALTITPVFSWRITDGSRPLFLEAGIGGSYFDQTEIGNRRLSTHFQFEDRIGLAWQYSDDSDARVSLQYTHYSNADIERPNDGLDFFSVYWSVPL